MYVLCYTLRWEILRHAIHTHLQFKQNIFPKIDVKIKLA